MRHALLNAVLAGLLLGAAQSEPYITLDVRDANLVDVVTLLSVQSGTNIVADASLKDERISLHLRHVTFGQALEALVRAHGLSVRREGDILLVGTSQAMNRRFGDDSLLGPSTKIFRLAYGAADDVAKQLQQALPDGTIVVSDKRTASVIVTGDRDELARAAMLVAAADKPDVERGDVEIAHAYALRFVRPSQVAVDLKGALPDGSYLADDAQNAILVTGDARTQRVASGLLRSIDVPTPQVLFEVRVADVVPESASANVGVEFGGYDLSGTPIPGAATYAFTKNSIAINARLNAMLTTGRARILATPKLVTLNNKEADLLIGETYPVVFFDARVGGQQVQFVDVGVKLRLTPTIGSDGSVTAEMHPEYSAIQTFVGGYPVIANRKIDSTLRVRDNETIVLGGLLRDIDSQTLTKVPWLADIPIFGKVFQNRQSEHERDEVVFLITPHVLYPNARPPQH